MEKKIKCFEPEITENDCKNVIEGLKSKVLGFGPPVQEFENRYKYFSTKDYNVGFSSASAAAYTLYQYLFEKCGPCRIYTPSMSFVSPAWAALRNGHQVILTDVNEDLLMTADELSEKFIQDGVTSVVMPVLYGGISKIENLFSFAKENKSIVVLDSAHCVSPKMKHDYAFYSFHSLKPVCMSNGGLLSTDIKETADYCHTARNFGRIPDGDTYDLIQNGFNFYMNSFNATLGLSQLETVTLRIKKRRENFLFLNDSIPSSLGRLCSHDNNSSYYMATLILEQKYSSKKMRNFMRERGIQCTFHYPPLHETSFYKTGTKLKNLDNMRDRIINIPIHESLTREDLERIINECIHYSRSGS